MKREKKLTKRERKATQGPGPSGAAAGGNNGEPQHIHCVSCGRHIDPFEFDKPATATLVMCDHKSKFACCVGCVPRTTLLLAEHDRTGQPVQTAEAWH